VKCAFIQNHAFNYPVTFLCRVIGVKHSSYYDWRGRGGKVIPSGELQLRRRMKELFHVSRKSLGSRMMMQNLRDEGFDIGRYRVRMLMKSMGLVVKHKRKHKVTTDSKHKLPVAENILDRQFYPTAPNQVWATDITYLWTQEGWVYLAVVIDLCSRRVIGWAMDKRMAKALVIRALMMAINLRKPPAGLIHHSDRGSQYASHAYQLLLKLELPDFHGHYSSEEPRIGGDECPRSREKNVRQLYKFIKANQCKHNVRMMCRLLEVAPSGYYAWLKNPISDRAKEDKRLLKLIRASFEASQGVYGSPRVFLDLREAGETCSKHRVARLMRENNIRAQAGYRTRRYVAGKPAVRYRTNKRPVESRFPH
jgi:putative transposase